LGLPGRRKYVPLACEERRNGEQNVNRVGMRSPERDGLKRGCEFINGAQKRGLENTEEEQSRPCNAEKQLKRKIRRKI